MAQNMKFIIFYTGEKKSLFQFIWEWVNSVPNFYKTKHIKSTVSTFYVFYLKKNQQQNLPHAKLTITDLLLWVNKIMNMYGNMSRYKKNNIKVLQYKKLKKNTLQCESINNFKNTLILIKLNII